MIRLLRIHARLAFVPEEFFFPQSEIVDQTAVFFFSLLSVISRRRPLRSPRRAGQEPILILVLLFWILVLLLQETSCLGDLFLEIHRWQLIV